MKKNKILAGILGSTALTIVTPVLSLTSCGSDKTDTNEWVDITNLDFVPKKQAQLEGMCILGEDNTFYAKAIMEDPNILKEDLIYTGQLMLQQHFQIRSAEEQGSYKLDNVDKFKIKVSNINIEKSVYSYVTGDVNIYLSFDLSYEIKCDYTARGNKYYVDTAGNINIYRMPMFLGIVLVKRYVDIVDEKGETTRYYYTVVKGSPLEYAKTLSNWKVTITEKGTSTERSDPNIDIDNFVIDKDNIETKNISKGFFSNLYLPWSWYEATDPEETSTWSYTCLNIVSYYMENLTSTWGYNEQGNPYVYEEEEASGEGEEGESAEFTKSSKVLI